MRSVKIIVLTAFLSGVFSAGACTQTIPADSLLLNAASLRESFSLAPDRDLYSTGERLNFRAFNTSVKDLRELPWSKVLYVELIHPAGQPVGQLKLPLDGEGAKGNFKLSDTLRTGIYQLSAYTKWMRNFSPETYAYAPVFIINPEKPSTVPLALLEDTLGGYGKDPFLSGQIQLSIEPEDRPHGRRQLVEVSVRMDPLARPVDQAFCLSVIPKGNMEIRNWHTLTRSVMASPLYHAVRFIPETRGMSLSGRLMPVSGEGSIGSAEVHMTLLGAKPDYLGFHSDVKGGFRLALPRHFGAQDVLISVDHPEEVKILLDNEFSAEHLPAVSMPGMKLSGRKAAIEQVMVNAQLHRFLAPDMEPSEMEFMVEEADTNLFYNRPDRRLYTADYVELPTLEEFFFELVPEVQLKRFEESSEFVIYPYTGRRSLVLIDFVAVTDLEALLRIPPARIRYIDVVGRAYQRGDNFYDGIVSIVSKDGDLGGMELPANSGFFRFKSFEPYIPAVFPDYQDAELNPRRPDLRNTLLWIPELKLETGQTRKISFYTSDLPGEYQIVVRGVDAGGRPILGMADFLVE